MQAGAVLVLFSKKPELGRHWVPLRYLFVRGSQVTQSVALVQVAQLNRQAGQLKRVVFV